MLQSVSLAVAFITTSNAVPTAFPTTPTASTVASVTIDDPLAELLGKAVVIWCRPSSLEHGITMLDHRWSSDGELRSLTARFRWYGLWTEAPYTSTVKIEFFTGGDVPKVSSIEYDDNCLTPCEMCKKLGDARAVLDRKIEDALE